jgi:rSAM/selenodomain-associated transferase 2
MSDLELSVIVPTLNEAATLPALFATLAAQADISFEVLLCDGGSEDGTPDVAQSLAAAAPFACRVLTGARGRGRQLNAGAQAAAAQLLLFLHADSTFAEPLALRRGVEALRGRQAQRGDRRVAGRFALRFALPASRNRSSYFLAEAKARLDLPGCTHGDQGFLLDGEFFRQVGPFDEGRPVMEDTFLAEAIRRQGEWLLLPAELVTSPRRFESEGFAARQTLNALLMNCAAVGWDDFFRAAPDVYRRQDRTRPLQLAPFFSLIAQLLFDLPRQQRRRLWYRTGAYVRDNAWQLYFALQARRAFRQGRGPGEIDGAAVAAFRRRFDRLTDHPPGRALATVLVWGWFQGMRGWLARRQARGFPGLSGRN